MCMMRGEGCPRASGSISRLRKPTALFQLMGLVRVVPSAQKNVLGATAERRILLFLPDPTLVCVGSVPYV